MVVEDTVLVIVDVQGKLAHAMFEKERLFRNLQIVIQGAHILGIPVLWLEQYPEGLGATIPEIGALLADEEPISKTCFSACGAESFIQRLGELRRTQVMIAGIESHICVYQTTRDLLSRQFKVEVLTDAVSSRTVENRNLGLERMREDGASLTSVEMALFDLLKQAGSPQFKEIVKLVK